MKRFEFKGALHILIIFLLSIGSCLLYQRQLWFSTTVCILFLIGAGMHLYRIQFKQITLLRRLTDGLRYNDMTQNLHPPFKNKMMDEWAQELSNALKDFRGKLLAEEVKHQYYESLLNKVHKNKENNKKLYQETMKIYRKSFLNFYAGYRYGNKEPDKRNLLPGSY